VAIWASIPYHRATARLIMQTRTPTSAESELERVERYLASDPGNTLLLLKAVDLCLCAGRIEAARQHIDAARQQAPLDPVIQHQQGTVLIAQGKLDEAAQVFEALLGQVNDPNIAFNLAFVRYRQHRFAQARATLQAFMNSEEVSPHMATLFVRVLHHMGEFPEALDFVRRQMPGCDGDPEFLSAASLLLFDDGQLDEAQRLSDAALAAGARPLEALVVAGSLALGRDDPDAAIMLLNEALTINPADGRSRAALGMATLMNGDAAAAEVHLQRAVTNLPTHIGSLHALGWCQIMRRELAQAQQTFQKALELDRNFGETHGGLAVVNALQGKKSEAEEGVQRALRLDSQGLSARYAEMVLSGVVNDPVRFKKLALRLVSGRSGPERFALSEALTKRSR
jgi:tetratricopeptide (TPR) repeat protein